MRLLIGVLCFAVLCASTSRVESSPYRAWVEATLPGAPEGLASGPDGALYATIPKTGAVLRLLGNGRGVRQIAVVPSAALAAAGRIFGAHMGKDGRLYVAYVWHYSQADEDDPLHLACRNSRDLYTGIYAVDIVSAQVVPLLTKRDGWQTCFPDDLAADGSGNLYVTDLTLSGIWKINIATKQYSLWSADDLLQWPAKPYRSVPEGANDLVLSHDGKMVFVATDGYPAIIAVPINPDGSAGAAKIVADDLSALDGIALDDAGNVFVSEILRDDIVMISPAGARRTLIGDRHRAPLNGPTSLVYSRGKLCVANMGWNAVPEPTSVVCIAGLDSKP